LVVERNSGLVLTPRRILTLQLAISLLGAVKEVKGLLSAVPLAEVSSLEAKRMGAAGVLEVTANGSTFKLESKAGPAKDFAAAFDQARAGG
jgi:hypothetical protein